MLIASFLIFPASNERYTAVLKKVRYALCPMPYALCPIVPHLSEKGYNLSLISSPQIEPLTFGMSVSDVDILALGELGHSSLTLAADLLPL